MTSRKIYMLDTNMVSYLVGRRSSAARDRYLAVEAAEETIAISALTEAEVLFGFERQSSVSRLRPIFEELLQKIQRLPFDSAAADSFARLTVAINKVGLSLALADQLIASHAHAVGATLVTHDRAFHRLTAFLPVEDWATDL